MDLGMQGWGSGKGQVSMNLEIYHTPGIMSMRLMGKLHAEMTRDKWGSDLGTCERWPALLEGREEQDLEGRVVRAWD